jgi:arabinose-5-phosphate isomerase
MPTDGDSDALARAREVLEIEIAALQSVRTRLGDEMDEAVGTLLRCLGRVVVTGIGKSGAIARKIASTLSSTGTPALFLHPAEGVHGDLGVVTRDDVVIILSYSGESEEVRQILPALRRLGVPIVAVTGRQDSTLAQVASVVLNVAVDREACSLNLAPTASTTAMLAMGDALAVATMRARRFTADDFAQNHPAGALGRRLLLRVSDVMRTGEELTVVSEDALALDVLFAITRARAGAAAVTDTNGRLAGIITEGDTRRHILADGIEQFVAAPASAIMTATPRTTAPDALVIDTVAIFNGPPQIADLPVLDSDGRPVGMLMLKDVVRAGLA